MIDPAHCTFIVMFYCLLYITTLSCYPLNQAWYTWLYDYLIYGNPALFYGTKCHVEQSATPHGGGHLLNPRGPPLESTPSEQSATWNKVPRHTVGATSWNPWGPPLESVGLFLSCSLISRKLIILNKLQLEWVWEEVMDAGMISCL